MSHEAASRQVLISGAGIAGPTLAWFLARAGMRVTVVEKSAVLLAQGQNVDIQGAARTIIERMGLTAQVRARNTTEKGTQFIDDSGRPFAPFPVRKGSSASLTSEFEILRGDLAEILYKATEDHPNIAYKFSTTIARVIANHDDKVVVEFSNGEVQEFDLLVAADGQWSPVRKQCFPPEAITVIATGMYAVYGTIPRRPSDNDWWNIYPALGARILTLRPDPHGTIRAMFTCMPSDDAAKKAWREASRSDRAAATARDRERAAATARDRERAAATARDRDRATRTALLRKTFADAGWQAERLLEGIEQAPDFYFQAIEQIKMASWSQGRVVCVGDAAYAPTPLTGMGTSLAIVGAYVLAGELSKLGAGEPPSKAFSAYERALRPFVEEIQKIPFFFPAIAHPKTKTKRWLLRALVTTMSKMAALPWLARRFDDGGGEDFPLPRYPRLEVSA